MFGNIVVATDLQASTRQSLAAACDLLHSQGQVLLVHVVRPVLGLPEAEHSGFYKQLTSAALQQMFELAASFKRERGVEILCLAVVGTPGRQIARIAADRQADLVVLAHDPADDPSTLGSVSYQVAHLAPCAVMVLKTATALDRRHASKETGRARVPYRSTAR
jgi:nucleotide-binding universal stress UspA family protein